MRRDISYTCAEYLDIALNAKAQGQALAHGRSSRTSGGGNDFKIASRLALEGWPEGLENLSKVNAQFSTRLGAVETPGCLWDVAGDFVDVGAYVSGEPECMVSWQAQESQARVLKIALDNSASAGVSGKTMTWRGAALVSLIDQVEKARIRAEVDLLDACSRSGSYHVVRVKLKEASQPVFLDRLAFHLAHPYSLRSIMFSVLECQPAEIVNLFGFHNGSSYASCVSVHEIPEVVKDYDMFIPALDLTNLDECVEQIRNLFGLAMEKVTLR